MKTMSYHYNRKKNNRVFFYGFLSLVIILAIFTSLYSHIYDILERPLLSIYKNTEQLKKDSHKLFKSIFYSGIIFDENKELKEKVEKLETEVMRNEYLESIFRESENITMYDPEVIYTSVIKKNNSGTITVLGGKNLDINKGDVVISNDGSLLGEVSNVLDVSSIVNLYTKEGLKSNGVFYMDGESTSVEVVGNGNAIFASLNRDINVKVGDVLYFQEEPGYVIGTVSYIDFDPRDPLKNVYISPIHGVQSFQRVGVIKNKNR